MSDAVIANVPQERIGWVLVSLRSRRRELRSAATRANNAFNGEHMRGAGAPLVAAYREAADVIDRYIVALEARQETDR
jgi:hypothetical protein|tara:strand:- start:21 stop:254 length:234 start_codon:yes stop_codon:yes gene_type:complete